MLTNDFLSNNLFSDKFSSNMDSTRHCVRRVVPHKEAEFSNGSIMKAMERFVEAVQEMDETILVPSRLMDLEAGASGDTAGLTSSTDLYGLYTMVNCVKNELLWGANTVAPGDLDGNGSEESICCGLLSDSTVCTQSTVTSSSSSHGGGSSSNHHHHHHNHHHHHHHHHHKAHARRPSTTSVASTQSVTLSDTDSDASSTSGNENDSGIEGETEVASSVTMAANNKGGAYARSVEASFRRHLYGLHRSLAQMTAAASYLTKRYQSDIGATV